jgi:hypothetical protein
MTAKLDVDHVGGAVQRLGGPEDRAREAMRDHHVIANRDDIHRKPRVRPRASVADDAY